MNELQNIILNSVKNPSYFRQLKIKDLIEDDNIKDELLNILQIITTNFTSQNNQLKKEMEQINNNLDKKIDDIDNRIKDLNEKIIHLDISINSCNNILEANKVLETFN